MGEKGLENVRFVVDSDTVIDGALFLSRLRGVFLLLRGRETLGISISLGPATSSPRSEGGPLRSQCFAFEKVQTGTEQNVPFQAAVVVHVVHITQCRRATAYTRSH